MKIKYIKKPRNLIGKGGYLKKELLGKKLNGSYTGVNHIIYTSTYLTINSIDEENNTIICYNILKFYFEFNLEDFNREFIYEEQLSVIKE